MSVFKEKNSRYEGANLLCGPMMACGAPSGSVPTSRFTQTGKTRLETYPGRFPVDRAFLTKRENWCDSSHPTFSGKEVITKRQVEH